MISVYGAQSAESLTRSEERSAQDEELRIRTYLAPLKQASEAIQARLLELDTLLKHEAWQEKLTEEVLGMYQSLERALDIFPLMYRKGLREAEKAYKDDTKLSALVAEYADFYRKTPLTHTNRVVEMLKEAHQLFRDVRVFLKHRHGMLAPLNFDKLSFYQQVSLPGSAGLERYLRTTAKELVTQAQHVGFISQAPKRVTLAAPVVVKSSEDQKEREIAVGESQIKEAFERLGEQNERLFRLGRHIETVLGKTRLTGEDLEILLRLYQNFYSVLVFEHVEVKREVDAVSVSIFDNPGLYAARDHFFSDYERFHGNFSKHMEQFHRQGLAELELLQNVFNSSGECVEAYLARNQGLGLAGVLRKMGFSWDALYAEESIKKLIQLLFWTTSSHVVQEAVRGKAYALLEQIQIVAPTDSIRWVIETIQTFWLWKQKLHDQECKDAAKGELLRLKANVHVVKTPFIRFKDQLCASIDQLLEGAMT